MLFEEPLGDLRHRFSLKCANDLQPAVKLIGDIHYKALHNIYIYACGPVVKSLHPLSGVLKLSQWATRASTVPLCAE